MFSNQQEFVHRSEESFVLFYNFLHSLTQNPFKMNCKETYSGFIIQITTPAVCLLVKSLLLGWTDRGLLGICWAHRDTNLGIVRN